MTYRIFALIIYLIPSVWASPSEGSRSMAISSEWAAIENRHLLLPPELLIEVSAYLSPLDYRNMASTHRPLRILLEDPIVKKNARIAQDLRRPSIRNIVDQWVDILENDTPYHDEDGTYHRVAVGSTRSRTHKNSMAHYFFRFAQLRLALLHPQILMQTFFDETSFSLVVGVTSVERELPYEFFSNLREIIHPTMDRVVEDLELMKGRLEAIQNSAGDGKISLLESTRGFQSFVDAPTWHVAITPPTFGPVLGTPGRNLEDVFCELAEGVARSYQYELSETSAALTEGSVESFHIDGPKKSVRLLLLLAQHELRK